MSKFRKLLLFLLAFAAVVSLSSVTAYARAPVKPAPTNTPPTIAAASEPLRIQVNEGSSVTFLLNATDPDKKEILKWTIGEPQFGSASFLNEVSTGKQVSITYVQNKALTGTSDSFTVTVTDKAGVSDSITVEVSITAANHPPQILEASQTLTVQEDASGGFALTASDADGDPLSWYATTPSIGSVVTVPGTSSVSVTYTPNPNANGSDSFTVSVSDGRGGTDSIAIYVNILPVNDAPVIAQGDAATLTISSGEACLLTLSASDADADLLSWLFEGAPNGTLSQAGTGDSITVTYTPNPGFAGTDSFSATVSDGHGGADTLAVTVTVEAKTTIRYTALGDSIATGTIYPGKTITTYVTYFYQYLQQIYGSGNVISEDFSHDGDTTADLLALLNEDGTDLVNSVINADVITVSIGGNNLMQACKDSSALGGYNFNTIDTAVAEQGRADFQTQFPQIIEQIQALALNPDVKIIVISMYNPYNVSDALLHNTVDSFLFHAEGTGINDIIYDNTDLGYSVADVYTAFDAYAEADNMGAITYFYPTDLWGILTRNPHPNALGQSIITDLHIEKYQAMIS